MQHTTNCMVKCQLPQCTINKAFKFNSIFCPNFQVYQLLIISHKLKHEVLDLMVFKMFYTT